MLSTLDTAGYSDMENYHAAWGWHCLTYTASPWLAVTEHKSTGKGSAWQGLDNPQQTGLLKRKAGGACWKNSAAEVNHYYTVQRGKKMKGEREKQIEMRAREKGTATELHWHNNSALNSLTWWHLVQIKNSKTSIVSQDEPASPHFLCHVLRHYAVLNWGLVSDRWAWLTVPWSCSIWFHCTQSHATVSL